MRWVLTIAVVLAVVATALAALKEQSESRRLQYDLPALERRLERLERRVQDAQTSFTQLCSPRSLLNELEGRPAGVPATADLEPSPDEEIR